MILITGAAGAIGKATVQQFLDADYHVLGIDRDASITDLFQTPEFIGLQIDVTDEYGLHKAVQYAADHGGLKHVVQIAGGALPREPVTQNDPLLIDVDLFRASLDENLTSQFIVLRAALPLLRATRYGDRSITLTSSINALAAMGMPAYSAAKAGLIGMMHVGDLERPGPVVGEEAGVAGDQLPRRGPGRRVWEAGHQGPVRREPLQRMGLASSGVKRPGSIVVAGAGRRAVRGDVERADQRGDLAMESIDGTIWRVEPGHEVVRVRVEVVEEATVEQRERGGPGGDPGEAIFDLVKVGVVVDDVAAGDGAVDAPARGSAEPALEGVDVPCARGRTRGQGGMQSRLSRLAEVACCFST